MSRALIVTGMHRSGTSFVAEILRTAGVHMGDRLFPADAGNPRGYFEDEDFLALQREMLVRACRADLPGWPDWGWNEREELDGSSWSAEEPRMRALIAARAHLPLWGWKDPRTTLLLERWHQLLPDARFLFAVREPWAVAASVRRLPAEIFMSRPEVAVKVWSFYNRRVLRFALAHPAVSVVVPTGWWAEDPTALLQRIALELDLHGLEPDRNMLDDLIRSATGRAGPAPSGAEEIFERDFPEAHALWRSLLGVAEQRLGRQL